MKQIFLLISIIFVLASCKKDEAIFDADPADVKVSFEPFAGGAYMSYELPDNSDIYAIEARYKDYSDKTVSIKGTYLSNQVSLFGFIDAEEDVPVELRLINYSGNYSKSVTKHFQTLKCAANSFFDNLTVSSYWDGFKLQYIGSEKADGFFHVGYYGINPKTGEEEIIPLTSDPIESGSHTLLLEGTSDPEKTTNTVVVWTEDFKGNKVNSKTFEDVPIARAQKVDGKAAGFTMSGSMFPYDAELYKRGWKYLFDGDTKGMQAYKAFNMEDYMWFSDNYAVPGFWTIDLQEARNLAYIKIYAPLNNDRKYDFNTYTWYGMIPSHVKVYASNDEFLPVEEWDLLGTLYQPATLSEDEMWLWPSLDPTRKYTSLEEMENAEPTSTRINFPVSEKKYRYIKLNILETFEIKRYGSPVWTGSKAALQELEVYETE